MNPIDMDPARIPIVEPTLPTFVEHESDLRAILANPRVTCGHFVSQLKELAARVCGVDHAVAVSSCTSGLMIAIRALGLRGEVILPAFTWTATGEALLWHGIRPVFADVLPGTLTLDPEAVEAAITERTTAICPVSVFGLPPDVDALQAVADEHGLSVFYDSAQALGATFAGGPVGGFGRCEVFSMSPTKVVTSVEGGLITTRDGALAATLRRLRDYGKANGGEDIDLLGLSARQSELHGLIGLRSLQRVQEWIAARARRVHRYRERLAHLEGIAFQEIPPGRTTTWNYFTLFVGPAAPITRDALKQGLAARSIESKKYFYPALHRQQVFADFAAAWPLGSLPVTEAAAEQGLALPLYSHMTEATVDRVCDAVLELWR